METFKIVLIASAAGFALGASLTAWLVRYCPVSDSEKKPSEIITSV